MRANGVGLARRASSELACQWLQFMTENYFFTCCYEIDKHFAGAEYAYKRGWS
jgi:hypothetical protein